MCCVSSKVKENYCMRTLRFMLINSVYWCASERMHAAHPVFAAAEVVTESRTERKGNLCESRNEDIHTTSYMFIVASYNIHHKT